MPEMTDSRELFIHELGDVLYAENVLVKAVAKLAGEASDEQLRSGFEKHLDDTREHIARLNQVFENLGERPTAGKCPGIDGIKQEHDDFMREQSPSPEICDLFLTGAGARAEHYEIAAYSSLVTMAQALGEDECASLLEKSLEDEEAALEKLETASRRLAKSSRQAAARSS
jgi:ferritin-like metal-binding protein YciE